MRSLIAYCLLAISIVSCGPGNERGSANGSAIDVDSLFKSYYQYKLEINPVEATKAGENDYNDYVANYLSDEYIQSCVVRYEEFLKAIDQVNMDELSASDQISLKAMHWDCSIKLEGLTNDMVTIPSPVFDLPHFQLMPLTQISSFQLYMGQLAGGASVQPFNTVDDYDNWVKRVDDYIVWLGTAKEMMQKGLEEGLVLPKVLIERVIAQTRPFAEASLEDHVFYGPVSRMPSSFSDEDRSRLGEAFQSMIMDKVRPAYQELLEYLVSTYLPAGRDTDGIDALPNGPATYEYLIKYHTTTNMTPEEIFELGKSEVARIREEMEKVKEEVGFEGSLQEFFVHVRTNPDLEPFTDPQQVIDHFNEIRTRMEPHIGNLFSLKPKAGFEVRRTEAFREASASAEYVPGTKDGSRPGVFYVPIPDVTDYNTVSDEALFLHEAIPGHHYQLSLQQENANLPEFLHAEGMGVYVEGWALYSESLGKEMGLYEDPYQYFGMLSMEMHRAIRLVVDAGMHSQGWTREQAIQFSLQHEAESEDEIASEIERYMAVPAQALSYKVGQLKIRELREKARQALGDRFDIREFHSQVLNTGSLPLTLLEDKIDNWIQSNE